jgi:enoyl-[acyl-carrier protein] reductase II
MTTSSAAQLITEQFAALSRRGTDFLGSRTAIMGGAMTWVSERHLVAALTNAGAFGVLASGSMPAHLLAAEIQATQALTQQPFGVNLITLHPQLDALIDVCLEQNVTHIVLAGGVPSSQSIKKIKDAGRKVMCFTPAVALGKRLIKMGADALVIEGMEAGGHIGPVSTSVLAQEILPEIEDVPIFVAGGIGRGEAILAYLQCGAAGVQLGTRFVCASESIAHPNFKQAFIRAAARDALPSMQLDARFPVIPVRAITNDGTRNFTVKQRDVIARFDAGVLTKEAAQLEIEHYWAGALRRAVIDGDVDNGSLMAGQSVGMVKAVQPAATIINDLIAQAEAALLARNGDAGGVVGSA